VLDYLLAGTATVASLVALWAYFRPRVPGAKRPSGWLLFTAFAGAAAALGTTFWGPPDAAAYWTYASLLVLVLSNWDEFRNGLRPGKQGDK
jgi:hypothetical protein